MKNETMVVSKKAMLEITKRAFQAQIKINEAIAEIAKACDESKELEEKGK